MRYIYLGLISMFAGFALMLLGGAQAGIFLIFPFVVSTGPYAIIGAILIFLGFILIFLGFVPMGAFQGDYDIHTEKRGIGVVLIGPIPLIIDTKNRALTLLSIAIFLIMLIILFLYLVTLA